MKKIKITNVFAAVLLTAVSVHAQKTVVKKGKSPAPVKATTVVAQPKTAVANNGITNSLSYTITEQNGNTREIIITSAAKAVNEQSGYFNTARVDLAHTDGDGKKEPVLKLDINNEKNQNISAAMMVPFVNDTGSAEITSQSNYDNLNTWVMHFDGYRVSPQNIIITITKWAQVGDFMEGIFSGTASLVQENKMYDSDNPAPVVNIKNGKFRIKRVKDQTGYGGE
jgi:hypothetical protein